MKSDQPLARRDFLKKATAAGVGALAASRAAPLFALEGSPAEKMVVAVMGLNGRGMVHVQDFARGANTTVGYLIDVDAMVLNKAAAEISTLQSNPPKLVSDFRGALEDRNVDALIIAAPDHWHTAATILALDAGKHVYVEKPSGHDPREDELIVQAARKHPRLQSSARHAGAIGTAFHRSAEHGAFRCDRHAVPRAWLVCKHSRQHRTR